ncbi:hypothetical protein DB29_03329 [Shouchella clausii]|nr:hypothetical protein DB29_03329 [Shouchella clausii]
MQLKAYLKEKSIDIEMEAGDLDLLREHTVDYMGIVTTCFL